MTNKFVVDWQSLDFNQILEDLNEYIESKPDAAAWQDFFDGSAGTIVKELIAGHAAFLSYQTILARRETFLRYMQNRTSAVGFAQSKGYSVFRGRNARIKITYTPSASGIINKFDVVGIVKDSDLIATEDVILIAGTPVTFEATIGIVLEETKQVADSSPKVFNFDSPRISDDIIVLLNDVPVETSNRLVDANLGKFVIQSNPVTSVDIFYLNLPEYTVLLTGDEIKIKYIELDTTSFVLDDINANLLTGTGLAYEIVTGYLEPETVESIKINAPLYQETQFVIRAREDYAKVLRLINTDVIDSNFIDYSPMVVILYYVKSDMTLFTLTEKTALIEQLSSYRSAGLEPPTMGDPIINSIGLDILIKIDTVNVNLITQTQEIVSKYELELGATLDFEALENEIEDLDGVRIARVELSSDVWTADTQYEVGKFVEAIGGSEPYVFRMERKIYLSDTVEPVWPTTLGDEITDGKIVWRTKYLERQCDPLNPLLPLVPPRPIWQASGDYKVGDIVIPTALDIYEYECVDVINESDSVEPTWPILDGREPEEMLGETVYDGELIWSARPLEGTPAAWVASTKYNTGDVVVATDPSGSDTVDVMFQCIGFVGKSDSVEPTWNLTVNALHVDNNIEWRTFDRTVPPVKLNNTQYYKITSNITVQN